MPKYAIAFHSPSGKFYHQLVDLDTQNSALKFFFDNFVEEEYSKDAEGFTYFNEDFTDPDSPSGSIIEIQ